VTRPTDESNVGIWLWLALILIINITWISMDIWLAKHHHEMLTTEFREGLHNPVLGPFVGGATAFTAVAFCTHMWNVRGR
jgi:hypothetical protein